jgi:hypothetical protein
VTATPQQCLLRSSATNASDFGDCGIKNEEICIWHACSAGDDGIGFSRRHGPRYTKAPPAPVVVYSWTGCYIGGNVGGGWERTRQTQIGQNSAAGVFTASPGFDFGSSVGSDVIGGGQIGCDDQFANNWVIGIQGMYDYARINHRHAIPIFPLFNSDVL